MTTPAELGQVRERVHARYAQAVSTVTAGGVPSCGDTCVVPVIAPSREASRTAAYMCG
jgi:hypothetical protein